MKLRNKKTGEIVAYISFKEGGGQISMYVFDTNKQYYYNYLAELNKEWEDYEEDELLYVISAEHKSGYQCVLREEYPEICEVAKELGIGFETEKECRKALEKLKAWKRLKDKGFRFVRWLLGGEYGNTITFSDYIEYDDEIRADLDLLFGGGE